MTLRKAFSFLALLTVCTLLGSGPIQDKEEERFVALFNGKDLSGFRRVGGDDGSFTVKDGALFISGKPGGIYHIRTEKIYKNYVLRFDWKFLEKNGDSGCYLHIDPSDKEYIQAQGRESDYGYLLRADRITTDDEARKKAIKIGEWNSTEIISNDGELTVKINGTQVCTGKGNRAEGHIGFQSENAPILYKNIRIKEML